MARGSLEELLDKAEEVREEAEEGLGVGCVEEDELEVEWDCDCDWGLEGVEVEEEGARLLGAIVVDVLMVIAVRSGEKARLLLEGGDVEIQ